MNVRPSYFDSEEEYEAARATVRAPVNSNSGPNIVVDWPLAFSDDALAMRFSDPYADQLRFVAAWGKWLWWDGKRWTFEDTKLAFDLARVVCREAAGECNKPRSAALISSAKTVAAVINLASADRRIAARIDQWDTDPWLLNTPFGVVDLRSGATRPHSPLDYMTRIMAAEPHGECPRFKAFLHRITGHDAALVAYLRRMFGYALTGVTNEHALFFAYGTGANGKSVLITTISGIMGDYHKTAPIETFTASNVDHHPTDLAMLRGARLVTATETEEGRRWVESRIKTLTGGDKVSARFMRQDFFEYQPQFKLVIAGNHKPGLRSVDEAIRRRFHLIPFAVTIPPDERDPDLAEKLKGEWPGILQWMIDGALEWQTEGLQPPQAVREATAAYLEAEDALSAWIDDRCERDPNGWESSNSLYASFSTWADANGEFKASAKRFGQALETRGFTSARQRIGQAQMRGFHGLRLANNQWDEGL